MSKQNKNDSADSIEYKIIIIGDMSVGKTSITVRYTKKEYNENNLSTIGTDIYYKYISDDQHKNNIKVKIIDTAGQERYRTLVASYYKNAEGVLIVYSVDPNERERSIEGILVWLNSLIQNGDNNVKNIPLFIVANKIDLLSDKNTKEGIHNEFLNTVEHLLQSNNTDYNFTFDEIKKIDFYICSAKSDENVDAIFIDMLEKMQGFWKKTLETTQKKSEIKIENVTRNKKTKCCLGHKD